MTEKNDPEEIPIAEFTALLGGHVTIENVRGRIRRGSLRAYQDPDGEWLIPKAELERLLADVEPCNNCASPATSYLIVKYHHHHRVEFTLCHSCTQQAETAYSRKGGVLEVVTYPLLGEGWLKPQRPPLIPLRCGDPSTGRESVARCGQVTT
jgi:hypothetical protein